MSRQQTWPFTIPWAEVHALVTVCLWRDTFFFPARLNSLCERSCWGRDGGIDACWVNAGHIVVWQLRVGCWGRKRACVILQGSNSLEINNVSTKVVKTDINWERKENVSLWTELRANFRNNYTASCFTILTNTIYFDDMHIWYAYVSHRLSSFQLVKLLL